MASLRIRPTFYVILIVLALCGVGLLLQVPQVRDSIEKTVQRNGAAWEYHGRGMSNITSRIFGYPENNFQNR